MPLNRLPVSIRPATPDRSHRHLSYAGLVAVVVGLVLLAADFRYRTLIAGLGFWGRMLLIVTAVLCLAWGVKDLINGWWPGAAPRRVRNRKNRFMWPVEGRVYGLIMMVLFCGSAIGRSNTLLLVFALMAGPFVMNGWITFMMLKKLNVRRILPCRVMAADPFSVELELSNPKKLLAAWVMSVRDKVGNGREELQPEVLFMRIPRNGQETGRYQLRLSERGRYTFGPIQINSRFPLGLVERGLVINDSAEILVYPRIGRFTSSWRRQLLTATQLVSQSQPRGGSFDDDFHRIREYRAGDDPRAIHWRTSARRDELMVREFRESRDRHLILLLDMYLEPPAREPQRQRLEFAISLAASIFHDQMVSSRGTDIFFAASGSPVREWRGTSQPGGREELFDLLALLRPGRGAEMDSLLKVATREQTPHSRTVLVTPTHARAAEWEAVMASHRGHGDLLAAIEQPQLIVADPDELSGVFSFI